MPKLKQKNSYLNHLLRNQLTSLILYEKIETTLSKAKKLKPIAEKLLSQATKNDLKARRWAGALLFDKKAIAKVFDLLVPKMKAGKQELIKIYRLGRRKGDNAAQALIMLGEGLQTLPPKPSAKKKKKPQPTEKSEISARQSV